MKREINYDKIYQSNNFGPFKILEDINIPGEKRKAKVMFLDTGAIKTVDYYSALCGNIRDDYRKTMHGVACKGNASSYHPAYNMWESMINRCYNPNSQRYSSYGAKGVTVCDKWLCFEYFLEDLPLIDGYENWLRYPGEYALDKDYKQMGTGKEQMIYSLETCCFIPRSENSRITRYLEKNKQYIGVKEINGKYRASINIGNHPIYLGLFATPELAACAYNNAIDYYHPNALIKNNVKHINPSELIKYNLSKKLAIKVVK